MRWLVCCNDQLNPSRELALPLVVGRLAGAMLFARLVDRGTEFNLLEEADYLGLLNPDFFIYRLWLEDSFLPGGSGFRGSF